MLSIVGDTLISLFDFKRTFPDIHMPARYLFKQSSCKIYGPRQKIKYPENNKLKKPFEPTFTT